MVAVCQDSSVEDFCIVTIFMLTFVNQFVKLETNKNDKTFLIVNHKQI